MHTILDSKNLPRAATAVVLGLLVLSFGLDMRRNPHHYEDRWSEDVCRSYGLTLIGLSFLGVAGYLIHLSTKDEEENEIPERTPILVQEVSQPKGLSEEDPSLLHGETPLSPTRIPYLLGVTGGVPAKVEIPVGTFVIGRSPNCDLVLSSQLVSRKHARIDWNARVLKLSDLGSSNTTRVNDDEVKGERILEDGDVIQVVDYQMEVSFSSPSSLEATLLRPKDV